MADIPLGSAWIDVGLKFDKLKADSKAVESHLKPLQTSTDKSLKNENKLIDEKVKKVHELLGVTEKLADADKDRLARMSFVDRTMAGMGAKINKGGMMGAQLSYAAQDFVTGLAMGNVNMAIMGASNNLGMMAMQISSAAAAWTTLGLVAIPLAITAFKAFNAESKEAAAGVDRMVRRLERLQFGFALNAIARERLTDAEVQRMHGAANLQNRMEGEQRAIKDVNEQMQEQNQILGEARDIRGGLGKKIATLPMGSPAAQKLEAERAGFERIGAKMRMEPRHTKEVINALGLEPGKLPNVEIRRTAEGYELRQKVTDEQKKKAEEDIKAAESERNKLQEQHNKHSSNLDKLAKQRDAQAKEELEFMQRRQNAGFNKYEIAKIELDREERNERRRLEESGFGDVVTQKAMTDAEHAKKQEEIAKNAQDAQDDVTKRMGEQHAKNMIHGRHLSKREMAGFDAERAEIEANRKKAVRETEAEWMEGKDKTLIDPALAANKALFNKRRIELAQQFANQGPGHFAGIAQLAKDVQQGIGGGKGLDLAQQTAANTKGTQQAIFDLTKAVKDLNLGLGP